MLGRLLTLCFTLDNMDDVDSNMSREEREILITKISKHISDNYIEEQAIAAINLEVKEISQYLEEV